MKSVLWYRTAYMHKAGFHSIARIVCCDHCKKRFGAFSPARICVDNSVISVTIWCKHAGINVLKMNKTERVRIFFLTDSASVRREDKEHINRAQFINLRLDISSQFQALRLWVHEVMKRASCNYIFNCALPVRQYRVEKDVSVLRVIFRERRVVLHRAPGWTERHVFVFLDS